MYVSRRQFFSTSPPVSNTPKLRHDGAQARPKSSLTGQLGKDRHNGGEGCLFALSTVPLATSYQEKQKTQQAACEMGGPSPAPMAALPKPHYRLPA